MKKKNYQLITIFILLLFICIPVSGSDWLPLYSINMDTAPGSTFVTASSDAAVYIAPDGNSLFIMSNRPGGLGGFDMWMSTTDGSGRWTSPVNMGTEFNTSLPDGLGMSMTADGLELFFSSNRGDAGYRLFVATRTTVHQPWSTAARTRLDSPIDYRIVTGVIPGWGMNAPDISPDGRTLYYEMLNTPFRAAVTHPGFYGNTTFGNHTVFGGIWRSERIDGVWQIPINPYSLNSGYGVPDADPAGGRFRHRFPRLSADRKHIYLTTNDGATAPFQQIFRSTRTDVTGDAWPTPVLSELDGPGNDLSVAFDAEMDRVVLISDRELGVPGVAVNRRVMTAVGRLQIRQAGIPVNEVVLVIGSSTTVRARGGLRNYSWSLSAPGVVSISSNVGREITLNGLVVGTVNLTLNEPGSINPPAAPAQSTTITVRVVPPPLVLAPAESQIMTVGHNRVFSVSGGISPYTWSLSTAIGTLNTTVGSNVTFTATGSGTVNLIVRDSASPTPQQKSVQIQIVPTTAPLLPEKNFWELQLE